MPLGWLRVREFEDAWANVRASGFIYGDFRGINGLSEVLIFDGAVYYEVDFAVEELLEVFEESEVGVGFAGSGERVVVD